jgi:hypothetical protein
VASGVNNAVSRVAGLLAIAVFGVVLTSAFEARVRPPLEGMTLSSVAREEIDGELRKVGGADVSHAASLSQAERRAVRALVENGFVGAFRLVMIGAAALALAGGACGLALPGQPASQSRL